MRHRSVIRMHTVNTMQAVGWPATALVLSLAIVLVIGAIVGEIGPEARAGMHEGMRFNGAIFAILGPLIGYGFTSMGQFFPLALGLGITRREYALGAGLLFLANAVLYTGVITVGKAIEVATDGFGLGVRFFDVVYVGTGPLWQTTIQSFLVITAALFLGAAITAAFLRLGQPFLWTLGGALGVIGVAIFAGLVLIDGLGATLLRVLTMGWGPWMGVTAGIALLAAGVWLLLVRRTQVR